MRWISEASFRLWQAYCDGLTMSSPVQRLDRWWACARDGNQEAVGDDAQPNPTDPNQAEGRTIH
jgi:hypothetical protein